MGRNDGNSKRTERKKNRGHRMHKRTAAGRRAAADRKRSGRAQT